MHTSKFKFHTKNVLGIIIYLQMDFWNSETLTPLFNFNFHPDHFCGKLETVFDSQSPFELKWGLEIEAGICIIKKVADFMKKLSFNLTSVEGTILQDNNFFRMTDLKMPKSHLKDPDTQAWAAAIPGKVFEFLDLNSKQKVILSLLFWNNAHFNSRIVNCYLPDYWMST